MSLEAVLAEVLAAHDWRWSTRDSRTGDGVRISCTAYPCGWYAERETDDDDVWTSHRGHVTERLAAAVLDWLRTELAAEGMREAVTDVVGCSCRMDDAAGTATAALEAVAERLAGGER